MTNLDAYQETMSPEQFKTFLAATSISFIGLYLHPDGTLKNLHKAREYLDRLIVESAPADPLGSGRG